MRTRAILIDGDTARVPLSQGAMALVDVADAHDIGRWNWTLNSRKGGPFYAVRKEWDEARRRQRTVLLHRLITNAPDGMVVDHINGDGLDNRRANLRVTTQAVNQRNRYYHRDPTLSPRGAIAGSGLRGVYSVKDLFVARAMVSGRQLDIARGKDPQALAEERAWFCGHLRRDAAASDEELADVVREIVARESLTPSAALAVLRRASGVEP